MAKEDVLMKHVYRKYGDGSDGLKKLMDDEHYTEEDVKSYIEFCDWQSENHRPQNINYYAWYLFVVLVHKIKAKGIESVLMREDVFGVKQCKERYYETERKFLAVETKYGTIVVYSKDEIKYRD